ncbi:MBL fold metallo-hydrolase [Oceanirhabdus sp. W0125-5]|uniref:MBL fold metallo-hydrolase n=1 Tax=Oceanirhabdus sp. W0125-5 TaxID=2999116 RepID=UPI0022F3081A|nr:MBL fold metallo-hydrolase [Oceanirhabdus sp. W0125-5]WBW97303.1 MBL fold metallo-hydrolase [Oceanirhabdus sp. W0125-5]
MNNTRLKKMSKNIYYTPPVEKTDRPILAAIVGKESVLIVDGGNSKKHAREFIDELNKMNLPEKRYLAITHWHWDHVFGIKEMNIPTFSHTETKKEIEKMLTLDWSDKALELRVKEGSEIEFCKEKIQEELKEPRILDLKTPDITYDCGVEIDLGTITCKIEHVGGEHSIDSSVIFSEEDKIIFIGDCLFVDIYHGEWSYSTKNLFPLIDKLLSYDADYYVESHVDRLISKEEMIKITNRLKEIGNLVDEIGLNKDEIINRLSSPINQEDIDNVDYFLAGLRKELQ